MVDRIELPGIFKDDKNLKNYFLSGQLFFHHNILAKNISRKELLPPPSYRSEQNIQSHCIVRYLENHYPDPPGIRVFGTRHITTFEVFVQHKSYCTIFQFLAHCKL